MSSGIYKITCLSNNRIYIGSAVNLAARKNQHFRALKLNKHENKYLQRAYNKYGVEAFIWHVLQTIVKEVNESHNDFKIRLAKVNEQFYLDTLLFAQEYIQSNKKDPRLRRLGFNILPIAKSGKFMKHSKAECKRIANRVTGTVKSKESIEKGLKTKLDLYGGFYIPTIEHRVAVSRAHKGKIVSEETRKKLSIASSKQVHDDVRKKNNSESKKKYYATHPHPVSRAVIQIDPVSEAVLNEFPTIRAASLYICGSLLACGNISNLCSGNNGLKTCKGFKWKYKNE